MKIAIVNNYVPFIYGGAEFLADSLKNKLEEYGHEAILIKIPFKWDPPSEILNHIMAVNLIDLQGVDRVIALKFPAYYINHPNKVLWLLHQFRQAYDLWDTPYQSIPSTPQGIKIRDIIRNMDNKHLGGVKNIFTNSLVVSERLKKFNNLASEVLFPPLMESEKFYCREYGNYLFYPSRIVHGKRQHLILDSLRYTKSDVKLVIAGVPESNSDLNQLKNIVDKYNLHNRVQIIDHFISQEEKAQLFANSLGCTYVPYDEDSYGYVTLEAYHSKKAVITCTDSGGTDAVVRDGITGYVVPPEPTAIAEAMDKLYLDRSLAKRLGEQGLENLHCMNITWEHVVRRLTS